MSFMKWLFCSWVFVSYLPPHGRFDEPMRYLSTVGAVVLGLAEIRNAILKTKQA